MMDWDRVKRSVRSLRSWTSRHLADRKPGRKAARSWKCIKARPRSTPHYERLAEDLGAAGGHERRQAAYDDA